MSRRFFRLSAVTRRIEDYLRPALGQSFWVQAELSSGRERDGHFFCDLVETDEQGRVIARVPCRIWERDLGRIRQQFRRAGLELELDDGGLVGLQAQLQYDARYGLSLRGVDMDPAVALGALELRRRRILERLEREGLLGRNARMPLAWLPNRIGVISSRASAGCRDLLETLQASEFGFRIFLADSPVQGVGAEAGVCAALQACAGLPLDLVILVRGGGSRSDLAQLDNEAIARAIAAHPQPVWTGIGHETDVSVLDQVAARAFKTPTAVAEALLRRFEEVDAQVSRAATRLRSIWRLRHATAGEHLRRAGVGLRQGTRKLLDLRRERLRRWAQSVRAEVHARISSERGRIGASRAGLRSRAAARVRVAGERRQVLEARLGRTGRRGLDRARQDLAAQRRRLRPRRVLARLRAERRGLAQRTRVLRAADPRTALGRGFSLTYTSDGALVRTLEQLAAGDVIWTRVGDGRVESSVDKTVEEDDA